MIAKVCVVVDEEGIVIVIGGRTAGLVSSDAVSHGSMIERVSEAEADFPSTEAARLKFWAPLFALVAPLITSEPFAPLVAIVVKLSVLGVSVKTGDCGQDGVEVTEKGIKQGCGSIPILTVWVAGGATENEIEFTTHVTVTAKFLEMAAIEA